MRYEDAVAFRQALEDRLKAGTRNEPARLVRDRKRVAFDRLLARLVAVAPGRWLLKGGFALDLRLGERARATKDVDIEWRANADQLIDALIEAANYDDAGDFFVFTIERAGTPRDRLGGSLRFRVQASLAGRPFETFLLDVGFRQGDELSAETLVTAGLLGFAEIAPVEVEAVPVELQVAEKLHAYTRRYDGGRINTRAKDLVDLTLVAELAVVEAAGLRQAVEATFADREAHLVPTELPLPPRQWAAQFHQLAEAVGVPGGLEAGHRLAAGLLDPVLSGEVTSGVWDPEHASWVDADTMPVNVPTPIN